MRISSEETQEFVFVFNRQLRKSDIWSDFEMQIRSHDAADKYVNPHEDSLIDFENPG